MSTNSAKSEVANLEAAMARRPPVIHWRLDPVSRIQVPSFIDDPYTDGTRNAGKVVCIRGHEFTDENTITTRDGRQCRTCKNEKRKPLTPEQKQRAVDLRRQRRREIRQEADELAEQKHRADNTPLMTAAARTI